MISLLRKAFVGLVFYRDIIAKAEATEAWQQYIEEQSET